MCGIAGAYVRDQFINALPLDNLVDWMFLGIEERGRHATGYVAVTTDNKVALQKNNEEASKFIWERNALPADTKMVLMHTRFATQGEPDKMENNHPVLYDTCFAVHNGHISNDAEVFAELGIERRAEVDSEAIAAALNYHGIGNTEDLKTGLESLQGMMAIAACDPTKNPGRLVLAKGSSSPLYVLVHPKLILWASQERYIKEAWANLIGTPPTRKREGDKPFGWYEFKWGDAWVIEDDRIEEFTFKPKYQYQGGTRSQRNTFQDDDDYGWWGDESHQPRRRWLCEDEKGALSFDRCIYPCEPGCRTHKCVCHANTDHGRRILERQRKDNPVVQLPKVSGNNDSDNLPVLYDAGYCGVPGSNGPTEGARQRCSNGVAFSDCEGCFFLNCPNKLPVDGADTGPGVIIECDGCLEMFDDNELEIYRLGCDAFFLCEECYDQEAKTIDGEAVDVTDEAAEAEESNRDKVERDQQIHNRALLEVAYELNCTVAFVDWILYRCPDEDLEDDAHLKQTKADVKAEYENGRNIATRLLEER